MPNPLSGRESAGGAPFTTLPPHTAGTDPRDAEFPVLFQGVSWDDYDAMIRIRGRDGSASPTTEAHAGGGLPRPPRAVLGSVLGRLRSHAPDRGRRPGPDGLRPGHDGGDHVAVVSPRGADALFQTLMTDLLRALRVPVRSGGSTTFRRQGLARGLEPDLCYYVRDLDRLRVVPEAGPDALRLPDLAIEVEVSRSTLDKWSIYAALGVPEVWRFDGQSLTVHRLRPDHTYDDAQVSVALPQVPIPTLAVWLRRGLAQDEMTWGDEVLDWIRQGMPPLLEDEAAEPGRS